MQKKRFDQKDSVNFEIYDVTAWLTKNYYTDIAQYLTNFKGNQTMKFGRSVNRISQEKYLFKNYAENEAEKLVSDRFWFFKKAWSAV